MNVRFVDLRAAYSELKAELDEACSRVLASGNWILGDECKAFEREFAAYTGAPDCVGVASGLDALTLVLRAHDIGPGHEVIVPAHTFIATWLAVSHTGARVVPVDVDVETGAMRAADIAAVTTARTRAVIVVHLYGQPHPLADIHTLAAERGFIVIEDAAQAHGARLDGQPVGSLADAAAFSFYPTKNLGAVGDGGAITVANSGVAARLRSLRSYGAVDKYDHVERGFNSRLDELQAAMLRVRLRHLDGWNQRRRAVADVYSQLLRDVEALTLPHSNPHSDPVWHLYVVRHRRRDLLRQRLADNGIDTMIHYPVPPHLSRAYADAGWSVGSFPIAEMLAATSLSLPMGPHLEVADAERVAATVRSCVEAIGA